MSTRATYRHLPLAYQAIRQLQGRSDENQPPTLELTNLCLTLCSDILAGKRLCSGSPMEEQIQNLLRSIANSETPGDQRARLALATLHFVERTLGTRFQTKGRHQKVQMAVGEERQRGQNCGTYGTPEFIAGTMVEDVLNALKTGGHSTAHILDLSAEAGQFPVTFLAHSQGFGSIRFYAVDRDVTAVRVTDRIVRFARNGRGKESFALKWARRDSLVDALPSSWPKQFSAVVGNPPWKVLVGATGEELQRRYASYLDLCRYDAYLAFIARAHSLISPGGLLSYVVPSAFLFNCGAVSIRRLLLENYDILNLRIYPQRSFVELPCVIPISFLAKKREGNSRESCATQVSYHRTDLGGVDRPRSSHELCAADLWRRLPGHVFHPHASLKAEFLLTDLPGSQMGQWGRLIGGAHLGRLRQRKPPCDFLGVHARHIRAFHVCLRDAADYSKNAVRFERPPDIEWVTSRKVVVQELRYMTHRDRLVAAVAGPGTCAVSTAMMLLPDDPRHCDFFAALLNCHVANAWYKLRDVSRSVKLAHLRRFPVPYERGVWDRVSELARDCKRLRMKVHRTVQVCTVANEQEFLRRRFPREFKLFLDWRHEIEEQIFNLYQLSAAQRAVVRKFSMTRIF